MDSISSLWNICIEKKTIFSCSYSLHQFSYSHEQRIYIFHFYCITSPLQRRCEGIIIKVKMIFVPKQVFGLFKDKSRAIWKFDDIYLSYYSHERSVTTISLPWDFDAFSISSIGLLSEGQILLHSWINLTLSRVLLYVYTFHFNVTISMPYETKRFAV